jgi:hypothetical protein
MEMALIHGFFSFCPRWPLHSRASFQCRGHPIGLQNARFFSSSVDEFFYRTLFFRLKRSYHHIHSWSLLSVMSTQSCLEDICVRTSFSEMANFIFHFCQYKNGCLIRPKVRQPRQSFPIIFPTFHTYFTKLEKIMTFAETCWSTLIISLTY